MLGRAHGGLDAGPDVLRTDLAPGEYTIYARREGRLNRTERTLRVDADGAAELG